MYKKLVILLVTISLSSIILGVFLSNGFLVDFVTDRFSPDRNLYYVTEMKIETIPILFVFGGIAFTLLSVAWIRPIKYKIPENLCNLVKPNIILLISMLILLLHLFYFFGWSVDDQFISYRYAENLAQGKGLVFNEGEYVEGYSNFLFVVMLAFFSFLGMDVLPVSVFIEIFFGFATLILLWKMAKSFAEFFSNKWPYMSLLFLSISGPFCIYAVSGMETTIFTFFVLLSVYLYSSPRSRNISGLSMAITGLLRSEGFVIVIALFMYSIFRNRKKAFCLKELFPFLIFSTIYLPYVFWKISYYGDFFPNTYHAKAEGDKLFIVTNGLTYLAQFLAFGTGSILVGLSLFCRREEVYGVFLFVIFAYVAFIVYVGGDWMALFRFFVPIQPLLFLITASQLPRFFKGLAPVMVLSFVLLMLVPSIFYSISTTSHILPRVRAGNHVIDQYREIGLWMKDNLPYGSMVFDDAGAIPYYSGFKLYDTARLVSKDIALVELGGNQTFTAEYILSKEPDYILMLAKLQLVEDSHVILRPLLEEIYNNMEFQNEYEMVKTFTIAEGYAAAWEECLLMIYARNT